MAVAAASSLHIATGRSSINSSRKVTKAGIASLSANPKGTSWDKLTSGRHISSPQLFQCSFPSSSIKFNKFVTKAMSESSENKPSSGLPIDLKGLLCFNCSIFLLLSAILTSSYFSLSRLISAY